MDVITRTTFHLQVSFAFFMYPIGASGNDPGRIDFKPGANPSTTPFFERGLHLSSSRWLYRTPPTLVGRLQLTPA